MAPVDLKDIVHALDQIGGDDTFRAWIDKRDGKVYLFDREILGAVEDSDDEIDFSDYYDWQHDQIREAVDFLDHWDYDSLVELPDKYEISEYDIMEEFGEAQPNPQTANQILNAIDGKGAFRRFRNTVDRIGLEDDWYEYRDRKIIEKVRRWCEDNDIDYAQNQEK